jgi:hypothetical protein
MFAEYSCSCYCNTSRSNCSMRYKYTNSVDGLSSNDGYLITQAFDMHCSDVDSHGQCVERSWNTKFVQFIRKRMPNSNSRKRYSSCWVLRVFTEADGSLSWSQEPTTGLSSEPDESSRYRHISFNIMPPSTTRPGEGGSSNLFPCGFLTRILIGLWPVRRILLD